jgi:hypothetical protein
LLPPGLASAVLNTPESQVSFLAHFRELFQVQYTAPASAFNGFHETFMKLISRDLTESLEGPSMAATLTTETRHLLSQCMGEDTTHWVEVPLSPMLEKFTGHLFSVLCVGSRGKLARFN